VPLRLSGGEPFGTLWVVSDREGRFTRDHAALLTELAECVGVVAAEWAGDRRATLQ
jgi:GAF domain-containing protein